MGLDMYLNRMPRYKEVTANQVNAVENWFGYEVRDSKYADCTFKEWCGCSEEDLPDKEVIEHCRTFRAFNYPSWDKEKRYGSWRIIEQVGYWRKANAIHQWFVDHVQDGIDDCDYHHEVTKEILEELRDNCIEVIQASKFIPGEICTGITWKNGETIRNYEDGFVMEDATVAERLLPTQGGFFFGSTDYDKYYIEDLKRTIEIIDNVLATTDFEKEMIYYVSSW